MCFSPKYGLGWVSGQQTATKHPETESLCLNIHFCFLIIAVGGKLYENSHSHTAGETTSLGGSAGYKRPQSSSSGPGPGGAAAGGGEDGVKKKKKGNWRNRFGPCFTTDAKPSEPAPSLTLPTSSTANTCSSAASPSSSSSSSSALSSRPGLVSSSGLGVGVVGGGGGERGLGVMGVSGGIQKSPSLLRNGSLQSNSSSAATGLGEVDTTCRMLPLSFLPTFRKVSKSADYVLSDSELASHPAILL